MNNEKGIILGTIQSVINKIFLDISIKDLIKENLTLQKINSLDDISAYNFRVFKSGDIDSSDFDSIFENSVQDLKERGNIAQLSEECYSERVCDIFNIYLLNSKEFTDDCNYDETGIPNFYPDRIKNFIKDSYSIFQEIIGMKESIELVDLINAEVDLKKIPRRNMARIFTMIFLGKVRSGRNITNLLFKEILSDTIIPDSFKRLCRINKGKYIIFNTDWQSLDFQLAIFDMIEFVDCSNKVLFNNKTNEYLKKRNEVDFGN